MLTTQFAKAIRTPSSQTSFLPDQRHILALNGCFEFELRDEIDKDVQSLDIHNTLGLRVELLIRCLL